MILYKRGKNVLSKVILLKFKTKNINLNGDKLAWALAPAQTRFSIG